MNGEVGTSNVALYLTWGMMYKAMKHDRLKKIHTCTKSLNCQVDTLCRSQ